ncbi:MAG: exosortase/archaeosortase family protein [Firmicutes bacterium]|nr:exosortase/archaeosortase family protein [Bacillota bacterium]
MSTVTERWAASETEHRFDWHRWVWPAALLALLVGFLYADVLARLVRDWWNDPDFSHGFFVPAFAGFVIWQRRHQLARLPLQPSWLGLAVIGGSLCTLIVGVLGAELFLQRSSFVLLLTGLVIHFFGWSWFRALLFPLACLFLMIPIPSILYNRIAFPLQLLASEIAATVLAVLRVPVLLEGNVIRLPYMMLEVVEACSGLRSLVSLLTLAVIYGHLFEPNLFRRAVLVLGAVPVAVLANSMRVAGTGLLGHYWEPEKAQGFFHTFSGLVVFLISLFLLFALHGTLHVLQGWWSRRKTL